MSADCSCTIFQSFANNAIASFADQFKDHLKACTQHTQGNKSLQKVTETKSLQLSSFLPVDGGECIASEYMKDHIFELWVYVIQYNYDLSYIHLHSSPSAGKLQTHKVTSSQLA